VRSRVLAPSGRVLLDVRQDGEGEGRVSLVVKSRSQVRGPHKPSQWIVWDGGFMGGRHLTVNEAVRHEWGEGGVDGTDPRSG